MFEPPRSEANIFFSQAQKKLLWNPYHLLHNRNVQLQFLPRPYQSHNTVQKILFKQTLHFIVFFSWTCAKVPQFYWPGCLVVWQKYSLMGNRIIQADILQGGDIVKYCLKKRLYVPYPSFILKLNCDIKHVSLNIDGMLWNLCRLDWSFSLSSKLIRRWQFCLRCPCQIYYGKWKIDFDLCSGMINCYV